MHPLDGSRIKIKRAKKYVQELELALEAFKISDPYGIRIKHNPQTGQLIYYASKITDVPSDIPAIAGDAIHNLRSALDYLVYKLVSIGIGGEPKSKRIEFPIFKSAKEYSSNKDGKIQGMRPDAKKVIDFIKPYKGGNDQLWRIHKLDIIDKHRLLISFGCKLRSVDLGTMMTKQMRQKIS